MPRLKSFAALSVALVVALAGCGDSNDDTGGSGGSGSALKVGTEGTYAPFTFHDPKSNDLTGYDVEVTNAVAKKLGRKPQYSETQFDAIFAGLESKRYDVVANQISINPEREAKYAFSTPYTASTGVVVTRADDDSVSSLSDIKGKKSAQSTTSNWAQTAKDAGAKVEAVEGLTQAIALLKQGRVDVTVNDNLAILDYLKSSGDKDVKIAAEVGDKTEQAFAFRKDSPLAADFDKALKELAADGTLKKISEKWFGEDVTGAS
ncbi:MAG: amino acid ABC transporter substrate-binding protein [Thermoleophilia bacterium]|nr:amino acid ABC transporter substrate-binding protein [Thermoleophilia bacterium]